ncbi:MBL fold metallo-hydrolase [Turicibacter sanguinis]|uniref:MBL fold metallo-hydrolase n=1 Tax=Turicibacter sanguinis TaxID=154288 RepID=UPI0012BCD24A|nr:MBL fold metallo-hydrolase [Turicibacter sanguinis]MTO25047.1 MBL fold metallo-hydrolase [Turicibacter sanguinis]MTO27893.1 MBL fold metallo-hydrolase [Turicibacter sanguinis]MTO90808.1 MBL fold metallo-hydrolase [Turicibacter sanguinis]MTP71068.1 MBL fold metallo-hydrolase [Turicibacter sanguinis]MTQ02937.1 MBL fold metallo-hydrolase [Turicibacter sanguinis]
MFKVLKQISNFWGNLSQKQKVILGCLFFFFGVPLIIIVGMFLFILSPFIAMIAAVVFLILALIKRDKKKQFGLSSIGAFVIAMVAFFIVDTVVSNTSETSPGNEITETASGQIEDDSTTALLHQNETINQLLTELNNKYGIGFTKETLSDQTHDSKISFDLNDLTVLVSDTEKNLFIELEHESQENNDGALIETFRQLMSALSPSISGDDFNTLVSELKTYNYQDYNKYTIDDSNFTLNRQELDDSNVRYTLKGQLEKSTLFTDSSLDYNLQLVEANPTINDNFTEESVTQEEQTETTVVEQLSTETTVHFIDTGHSDAVLIENNGQFALIDAGDRDDDATVKSYLKTQGVTRLEYLIITHFHADHFGAADTVINDFEVGTTLVSNGDADTQVYRDFINALANKGLTPSVPLEGAVMPLGNATLTFYNTKGGNANENNNSLVTLLQSGSRKALFTGDAESQVEATLTTIGDVDLFKAGHHGSSTSNTASLLNRITPEHVVIMAGANNQYGHPDAEVMNRFKNLGISVYRTDEQGTIIVTLSEDGVSVNKQPGSYQAGNQTESSSSTSNSSSGSSSSNTSPNTSSNQSQSTNESSTSTQYKDDNPNGIYNQESTAPKESYKNCTLLREVYPDGVPQGHPAYESKHDRDKDGWACER